MRSSLCFLVILGGANIARNVPLESNTAETLFNDSYDPDFSERHDSHADAAAQHPLPLARMDNNKPGIEEMIPIDTNPDDAKSTNAVVSQVIDSIDPIEAHESSPPKNHDQAIEHSILKRFPAYVTITLFHLVSASDTTTFVKTVGIPVTITQGTKPPVTITTTLYGPVTVTASSKFVIKTIITTEINTVPIYYFRRTIPPVSATDDFVTFVDRFQTNTFRPYVVGRINVALYTTITSPVTVTVTERIGPTVTVRGTFTIVRTIYARTDIPVTTRYVVLPEITFQQGDATASTSNVISRPKAATTLSSSTSGGVDVPVPLVTTSASNTTPLSLH